MHKIIDTRRTIIAFCGFLVFCVSHAWGQTTTSGSLRVGLYTGSPTSAIVAAKPEDNTGVGFELGRALAKSWDKEFVPVVFPKNADVFNAIKEHRVDLVFTNASPARAKVIAFSKPVLKIERGYLVPALSKIRARDDVDQIGVKVGVSVGSSSEIEMLEQLKKATLVKTTSAQEAIDLLKNGGLDVFTTNKAILYDMSDSVPGSQVLADVLGYEYVSLGVHLGQASLIDSVNQFVNTVQGNGQLDAMIKRSGLRGTAH